MTDVRRVAFEVLLTAEGGRGGSITSGDVLDKYAYLDRQSRSFMKRLIEGTIERRITIDHVLNLYSSVPVRKMKKEVRTLLRMGVYQLLYMDGVPDHAAVNETVKLIRRSPLRALSGFVNGVLHSVCRGRGSIAWPDEKTDMIKYLSVYYSCPEWIVKKLVTEQGEPNARNLLELSVSTRDITARINLSKTDRDIVVASAGLRPSDVCDIAVVLDDYDNIRDIPSFADGLICIQDISSMLVCMCAGIGGSDTVLDLCAAPGGKSLHAADIAVSGHVIACDVSEPKLALIDENIKRCGFTNIETRLSDATVYDPSLEETADVVIADVPCSGLGVMGRKNDIKYNLTEDDISSLVQLQRKILTNAARYVKRGGRLMFSTCTCSREENLGGFEFLKNECRLQSVDISGMIPAALRDDTAERGFLQLFGKDGLTDGFFIAGFTK